MLMIMMNIIKLVLIIDLLFVELNHSITPKRTELYRLDDNDSILAKKRFCSQSYFDSLSYNGKYFKFTVNHRMNNDNQIKYLYDEFQLFMDKNFNQVINHKNILYDFNNGIYLIFDYQIILIELIIFSYITWWILHRSAGNLFRILSRCFKIRW